MTDWTYGREAEQIHDLIEEAEDRLFEDGDFVTYFTLNGDPLCVGCARCLVQGQYYTAEEFSAPVGECYECGEAL